MSDETEKLVFEALDNSKANRYQIENMTDKQVARDLVMYCAALEKYDPESLITYILGWRNSNR